MPAGPHAATQCFERIFLRGEAVLHYRERRRRAREHALAKIAGTDFAQLEPNKWLDGIDFCVFVFVGFVCVLFGFGV